MAKRKAEMGLGRGLNALLGDPDLQTKSDGLVSLSISQVEPGLNQPRKNFDSAALDDLAESIRNYGVIQPVTVRRLSTGYYQIIAGERRWRAAKMAGLTEIPANIIEADDRKVMEIGLIENLQRQDLDPIEEANGYRTLSENFGLTQDQISDRIGRSRPAITNALRLLNLTPEVQEMLTSGQLSSGHGRALVVLEDHDTQVQTAKKVVEHQLSVRQTEALVKTIQKAASQEEQKKTASRNDLKLYLEDLSKKLSGSLGRKVKIQSRGKKGRVELEYYSNEDLETLLSLLETMKTKEAAESDA